MKRALMPFAALTTLLAVAACSTDDSSSAATVVGDRDAIGLAGTHALGPVDAAEPASPVDGTWRAGPFPLSRVLDSLRAAGYGSYFERMDIVPGTDLAADVVYDLKIQDGGLLMAVSYDGEPLGVVDRQGVQVERSAGAIPGQRVRLDLPLDGERRPAHPGPGEGHLPRLPGNSGRGVHDGAVHRSALREGLTVRALSPCRPPHPRPAAAGCDDDGAEPPARPAAFTPTLTDTECPAQVDNVLIPTTPASCWPWPTGSRCWSPGSTPSPARRATTRW